MSQSIVAVFENRTEAEATRQDLISSGISADRITLNATSAGTSASSTAPARDEDEGAIAGFFRSLFGSDDDSSYYTEAARRGHVTLVAQNLGDADIDRITDIMERHNAIDIDERASQWRDEGWSPTSASTLSESTTAGLAARDTGDTTARVPVIEESLQVGKRQVQRGGIRVYTRMTEVPVEESVQLREEHARVERHAVDRPVTEADLAAFKEGTIEVRETSEEAVVAKQARVIEEIEVGKEVRERTETVSDTVRKTDVRVENLSDSELQRTATSTTTRAAGGTDPLDTTGTIGATDPALLKRTGSKSPK